ncbi:MAG: class I SAM-dependent methyltransferase [Terracidiphilus sp.]
MLLNLPRLAKGYQPIFLDYRVDPIPRYGYGRPAHPELTAILSSSDDRYRQILAGFLRFTPQLLQIPARAPDSSPAWINKWFAGLDTFALYGFIAERKPSLYVEVGSGVSTRIVRRAIRDQNLATRIVSIDPHPRAEIDALCDKVIREPLERSDLSFIGELRAGDILFIDGSHRSFMNSDVTALFLEILPRLRSGVAVHIHDIFLPLDYPPDRAHWFYSEQYLLAASLLAGHSNYRVLLPNYYVTITDTVRKVTDEFWNCPELAGVPVRGGSFWIEIS